MRGQVEAPDCGRALVIGKLDAVPEAPAGWLRIRVCDGQVRMLPAAAVS